MRRNFESANGLVSLLNSKTPTRLQLAWRRSQHHGQHHPFLAVRRTAPWLVTKQSSCRLQWIQRFPVLSASKWAAKQKENAWWCSAINQFKWNFSNWLKACIFQRSPNANMSYKPYILFALKGNHSEAKGTVNWIRLLTYICLNIKLLLQSSIKWSIAIWKRSCENLQSFKVVRTEVKHCKSNESCSLQSFFCPPLPRCFKRVTLRFGHE